MDKKSSAKFSILKQLKSFQYAFRGIAFLVRSEHNAKIHLLALILVLAAGIYFQIEKTEWILVVIVSAFVFSAEAFNSSLENLANELTEEKRERIKNAKDLAAAAVIIAAFSAAITGIIIFGPHIMAIFKT